MTKQRREPKYRSPRRNLAELGLKHDYESILYRMHKWICRRDGGAMCAWCGLIQLQRGPHYNGKGARYQFPGEEPFFGKRPPCGRRDGVRMHRWVRKHEPDVVVGNEITVLVHKPTLVCSHCGLERTVGDPSSWTMSCKFDQRRYTSRITKTKFTDILYSPLAKHPSDI